MSMVVIDEPQETAQPSQLPMYAEAIDRLYRKGATTHLGRLISKLQPVDIANIIGGFPDYEAKDIFELIASTEHAGWVLKELPEDHQDYILSKCAAERAVPILESLPPDTRSDIIGHLTPKVAERLMNALRQETQKEVENLLQYQPETAGSLMTSHFFALSEETTAGAAIQAVRGLSSYEMVFYVYIINEQNQLTGVSSLRQLLLSPASKTLKEIMNPRVLTVKVDSHQNEVAKEVTRYRLLAMPVVDEQGVLRGIITMDDLIQVIQDATTNAMLRHAGSGSGKFNILSQSFFTVAKSRIPWLVAPFLGGLGAAFILNMYEHTLATVIELSFFMPLIFGMAGNVSNQTSTVVVRGLATGAIRVSQYFRLLFKEVSVSLLMGTFYALGLAGYAIVVFKSPILAFTISLSILTNILYAGIIASSLPTLLQKLGFDPALGAGPYVLTTVDVLGVVNYVMLATLIYGL